MGWFSITTTIRASNGANVQFAFRADGIDSLEDLADALEEEGVVVGDRFRVQNQRGEDETGTISDGKRTLLTREGVASVTPFLGVEQFELIE